MGLVNSRCHRKVRHELTVDHQQQQHLRVRDTCTKLLENTTDSTFWRCRVVACDEKWVVFYRKANREYVWIKPAAQPTIQVVAKQDRFVQKVVMLCVWWWNIEAIINHFKLVQNGAVNGAALYNE